MATMTASTSMDQLVRDKMRLLRVDEETARFICAIESGEIPGDVQYVQDGEVVRGRSPIPLRRDRNAVAKEAVPRT